MCVNNLPMVALDSEEARIRTGFEKIRNFKPVYFGNDTKYAQDYCGTLIGTCVSFDDLQ